MDLIDRKEAVNYLTKARMINDSRPMEDIFADIPSQNKWISVKERLPEEGTECLVTVLHNERYSFKYEYKVTEAYYAEYWGLFDDDYEGERILAWLPFPEPYKGSEE